MSVESSLPPPELILDPLRVKWRNRFLQVLLFAAVLIGILPVLAWIQHSYIPVLTEFEITDAQRVGDDFSMTIKIPGSEPAERALGVGVLLSGFMNKSAIYPKWACKFDSVDVSERMETGRWRRTSISYGIDDQPEGHGTTRMVGEQDWGPWHVRLMSNPKSSSLNLRFDARHTCFLFWPTLMREEKSLILG